MNSEFCKVKIEKANEEDNKNHHFIYTQLGERISGVVWTKVYDGYDEQPFVIVKLLIDLEK